MHPVGNNIMYAANNNRDIKVVKSIDKPIDPALRRLVASMAAVLKRTYPNPDVRHAVSERIMQELKLRQAA